MGIKSTNRVESYYNYFAESGKDAVTPKPGPPVEASGGVISDYTDPNGTWRSHIFTAPGTFVVTVGGSVQYLIIGGGGAARGDWPGGGGAGGVAHAENWPMTPGTYPVVVGTGGEASPISSGDGADNKGEDSTFNGITGLGGGAGTQDAYQSPLPFNSAYLSGGSGGGNGDEPGGPTAAAGTGTQPTEPTHSGLVTNYGNPGYTPAGGNTWPAANQDNGGGGGAGSGGPSTTDGGVGGNGAPFSNFPGPVLAPAIPGVPTWATVVLSLIHI